MSDGRPLAGKVAWVTGSSRGLGRVMAARLCSMGARVAIHGTRFDSPKSRYGRRSIPLSEGLGRALWRLRGTELDDALLFTTRDGTPLDAKNLAARVLKPA